MKVLHTIHSLNRNQGGPSSCTYQLAKGLNDAGVATDILTIASADINEDISHETFIRYVADDMATPLRISRNFGRTLHEQVPGYDIVHANGIWLWHSHQALKSARACGKPFALSPHGMLYPQALKVSSWKKKIILPLFQRSDLRSANVIHATSDQELRHIREFGLTNPVAVVPNMLVIDRLPDVRTTENTRRRIGFIGRLNPIKNLDLLLEAWHRLDNRTADCELVLIGSGDQAYVDTLKAFIAENNISNVTFAGFLSGNELNSAIGQLDYLILPSKSENFGMVVPEALVHGVPVIASKGTPWEIVETSGCGWWVDARADAFTDALAVAIQTSESDRRIMGDRGIKLVSDNFISDKVAIKMKQVYQWLLTGNEKPDFVYV